MVCLERPACGDDERPGRITVAGLECADDVHVVLCAQGVTPRRVAQNLAHAALHPEGLVGLQQVLVAGESEQVVVERRVGFGVLRGVDEMVVFHIRHRGLGQQPIAGQLLRCQASQGQLQCTEFQRLPCLEQRVGGVDLWMLLADLIAILSDDRFNGWLDTARLDTVEQDLPRQILAPLRIRAPSSASRGFDTSDSVTGAMSWPAMDRMALPSSILGTESP